MEGREDYADLGRADAWLRLVGFLIWAFVGLTHLSTRGPGDQMAWLVPWAVYGTAFIGAAFHARLPLWLARVLVAVQSGAVD